ncbi:PIR protein [Plasmodium ovale]|uniref:PIR Superfamily Protein n=2 Tax=Plasmodium ovale TaxID=36330 RepID=A0A1A8WFN9_PLAOA|nr:PIR Superfamily Protein [Plasmodium ovale curtisi]SBT01896.1 PIR Superfamily Protein [Plasmodium ovale curtisi]SBT85140.1 PIR protein [Plasmodium ovale]
MAEKEYDMPYLFSTNNYKKLDDWYYVYGDESKCSEFEKELEGYKGIKNFCLNLTGILKRFNDLRIESLYDGDRCAVINYWTYEYIHNKLPSMNGSDTILTSIGILYKYWNTFVGNQNCPIDTMLNVQPYHKKTKTLYDYVLDYDTIKRYVENTSYSCSQTFNDYIEEGFKIYDQVKRECSLSSVEPFCILIRNINKIENKKNLLKLTCPKVIDDKTYSAEQKKLLQREGEDMLQEEKSEYRDTREGEFGQIHHPGSSAIHGSPSEQSSSFNLPLGVLLPIFGIFLILFIFYKFTPFGPSLFGRYIKKKINPSSINEDQESIEQMLDNTYEQYNSNSLTTEHQIGYNPL